MRLKALFGLDSLGFLCNRNYIYIYIYKWNKISNNNTGSVWFTTDLGNRCCPLKSIGTTWLLCSEIIWSGSCLSTAGILGLAAAEQVDVCRRLVRRAGGWFGVARQTHKQNKVWLAGVCSSIRRRQKITGRRTWAGGRRRRALLDGDGVAWVVATAREDEDGWYALVTGRKIEKKKQTHVVVDWSSQGDGGMSGNQCLKEGRWRFAVAGECWCADEGGDGGSWISCRRWWDQVVSSYDVGQRGRWLLWSDMGRRRRWFPGRRSMKSTSMVMLLGQPTKMEDGEGRWWTERVISCVSGRNLQVPARKGGLGCLPFNRQEEGRGVTRLRLGEIKRK
jgi:hypothetical protein